MRILLHVCCAPDATTAYLRLSKNHDVVFYFYNPNIHPKAEYMRRLEATWILSKAWKVEMIEGEYDPRRYFKAVKGYEHLGEGSYRCFLCIRERLMETARMAKELGFDAFSTSLTTSPKKDYEMVKKAGLEAQERFGVKFVIDDFKKDGGYPLSVRLSKELGLYRQNYCGCIFSYWEARRAREESRRKRREKLKEVLKNLNIDLEIELDPDEMILEDGLVEKIGIEKVGEIIRLVRPRKLIVSEALYERYWSERKNARFGKFKVKLEVAAWR